LRLVHLTDPHLSTLDATSLWRLTGKRRLGYLSWSRRRRYIHRRDILDQLVAEVARELADLIVVTGDLVQLGLLAEITEAGDWLARLNELGKVILVPGNHDVYQHDAVPRMQAQWARYFHLPETSPNDFPSLQKIGDVAVIGLSSARPEPFWSAGGELGQAQLDRFERTLIAADNSLRCVLIHHPPLSGQCSRRKALRDTAQLEQLLRRYDIEVVLHGHIHRNDEVLFNARTRVLGTASASNMGPDGRASYRVLDFSADASHWLVNARLRTLSRVGENVETVAEDSWRYARRT